MDKNAIKKFAVDARVMLMDAVAQRAYEYGITEEKIVDDVSGIGTRPLTRDEANQRGELIRQIRAKGYTQVMEEVAYTWFNRFISLRFMEVNGYLPSRVRIFTNENGEFKPEILKEALNVEIDGLDREYILELLDRQENETLFKYLIIKQCNELSRSLPGMFEHLANYTELLFPNILLKSDSVIGRMISDIPEEDWKDQVQIIGWLYQYYSSEKKDEVFAALKKNVKITKENIPAATQLFTPDWIVRYMVENSLGRLWMDGHPNFDKSEWKYYLDEAQQTPEVAENLAKLRENAAKLQPEEIRFIDPSMGSGHVLVYAFDVLMQIYLDCGYTERDAAQLIVRKNLYGLDLDKRAYQLAYFAVMMKARKYDRRFLSRDIQPNLSHFQDLPKMEYSVLDEPLQSFVAQFENADTYGSLLTLRADAGLDAAVDAFGGMIGFDRSQMEHLMTLYRILSQKYDVVCTNPPYMGGSGMTPTLSDFVKKHYPDYKSDLFSAFMIRCMELCKKDGYLGFLTPYVWMFIKSYEALRNHIYSNRTIETLIQFEYSAFEEATVPICTFALKNSKQGKNGCYLRLTDFRGGMEVQRQKTLEAISNHSCGFYFESNQSNFSKIPGSPVAYWVGEAFVRAFENEKIGDFTVVRNGMKTGDNNTFIRLWWEVKIENEFFYAYNSDDAIKSMKKWFPYNKGGEYRRWYGNNDYIVNWENAGERVIQKAKQEGRHVQDYPIELKFSSLGTWSLISSGQPSFRYKNNCISDISGMSFYGKDSIVKYLIGLCNTKIAKMVLEFIAPTINYQAGDIARIPVIIDNISKPKVDEFVEENIAISKNDWDSFETSWDFIRHPLV